MYVDVGGRCVGVVGTRATAVPCALRTALDVLPDVAQASVRAASCTSATSRSWSAASWT